MFKTNSFIPFTVLGDPDIETSFNIIKQFIDSGANALELGFPFSDPIADGPIIQKANNRSLDNQFKIEDGFEIINKTRKYSQIPISIMLSFNLILQYGIDVFYKKCNLLNVNAVLCPDLPLEESEEVMEYAKKYNIHQVFLITPTTKEDRMKEYAKICSGYVYLVSLLGVTGTRKEVNKNLKILIEKVRKYFTIPIYVGFGISKPEHVKSVFDAGADGVIIGSAFCKIIENNLNDKNQLILRVKKFIQEINHLNEKQTSIT
tara:strand:+ start:1391 stop:2173 length:783 start_codon:yes stop_codon:yes gene_type:complete